MPSRTLISLLLAAVLVVLLQPLYFLSMANLDRLVSHDGTWRHIRQAFDSGVLQPGWHSHRSYIHGGDRFTDCYSLGDGLQPGVTALNAGIVAARPSSDTRHSCEDLRDAAQDPQSAQWVQYARYWHGYRLYSAPIASALPILALKFINLIVLFGAAVIFFWQSAKLIGIQPTVLLCSPVLFCSDFVRIWQITPHTVSTVVILTGAATFVYAIRIKASDRVLILLVAAAASAFNFVDFLLNPPWMPMLIAFFLVASGRKAGFALLCIGTWFGAYAVTWAAKWGFAATVYPPFDFKRDVLDIAAFRVAGDYRNVLHFPFAATLAVLKATLLSWGMIVAVPLLLIRRVTLIPSLQTAWPALIPIAWFEVLSNHSQIHAFFVSRSMAAAFGVVLASAFLRSATKQRSATVSTAT